MSAAKQKRQSFTDTQKLHFVKEYESTQHLLSVRKFCLKKGLSHSSFVDWRKKHQDGDLTAANATGRKKRRKGEFVELEEYLVKYVKFRQERFKFDRCGMSWQHLLLKSQEKAVELLGSDRAATFKASPGWLNNVLKKRNNILHVKLHGEGDEISEEKAAALMNSFMKTLNNLCDENRIEMMTIAADYKKQRMIFAI